ncbi:hypothetical protein QBC35DRAFT_383276 [Podospora australis]|uniref:PPPDE domain-containing protein n=1 Tax=Podospora australis TaxID=1536484 RepID=A0AAN6WX82_9PEZI|nr:hypothetical protein QBC35DRAFT_383276 [Podospora australis]
MGRHENYNRIPAAAYDINGHSRKVQVVHRTVGGVGPSIVSKSFFGYLNPLTLLPGEKVPDLTHHWAVRVGDWYHQLQATSLNGGDNYYDNQKYDGAAGQWDEWTVGETKFNDAAIASAGIQVINDMDPIYNAYNNNCQKFTINLLNLICRNGRKKVRTSYSIFTPLVGFIPGREEEGAALGEEVEVAYVEDGAAHFAQLEKVEDIMAENTPMLTPEEFEKKMQDMATQTDD